MEKIILFCPFMTETRLAEDILGRVKNQVEKKPQKIMSSGSMEPCMAQSGGNEIAFSSRLRRGK